MTRSTPIYGNLMKPPYDDEPWVFEVGNSIHVLKSQLVVLPIVLGFTAMNLRPCASQWLVIVLAALYTLILFYTIPLCFVFSLSIPSLRHNPTPANELYLSRSSFTKSCWSATLLQHWESRAMGVTTVDPNICFFMSTPILRITSPGRISESYLVVSEP